MSGSRAILELPGRSAAQVLDAAARRRREVPAWLQLPAGRTLATYAGRDAIALGCRRLGLGGGDDVLMPSYNCGTEVEAVLSSGASVVPYLVDGAGRADADDVRRRITGRTRAVYVTHCFGCTQPLGDLRRICRDHGLLLIEDCALALFSSGAEGWAGGEGDAAIFSFRKTLPVPDGGALVLRRPWADAATALVRPGASRVLRRTLGLVRRRLGGKVRPPPARRAAPSVRGRPDMPAAYYWDGRSTRCASSRMTLGILAQIDPAVVVARRRANYARLAAALATAPGVRLLVPELPAGACPVVLPLVARDRDGLVAGLLRRGVAAVPWWAGFHRALPWDDFPDACRLKSSVVALPVHQDLDGGAMDRIAREVSRAV